MPTYDYVCESCNHEWELYQAMTDKPQKKCPSCKKPKAQRKIGTGAGIIFKGSGFYITDYRSESYKKGAAADTNGSGSKSTESKTTTSDSSSSSSTTTQSKPKSTSSASE